MIQNIIFQKRKTYVTLRIALLVIVIFTACCAHSVRNASESDEYMFTEGFINNNVFRISIIVAPDANAKGLVARRESAQKKAEHNFEELLGKKIAEFRKTTIPSCKTAEDRVLIFQSKDFIQHTTKIAEYFKEDESIVIIVQISLKNLKNAFECQHTKEKKFL